jgi:hypothetical protein
MNDELKRKSPLKMTLGEARYVVDELRNRCAYYDELVDSLKSRNQYDVEDAKKSVLKVMDGLRTKILDMKIKSYEDGVVNDRVLVYEEVLGLIVNELDPS